MTHLITFLVFCFSLNFCVQAQPDASEKKRNANVDSFVASQMTEHHTAGLSLAVMRDDKLLYTNSYGYSNLEHKVPAINETVYSIASITKSFTGIATMILVEAGMISLDDAIGKYFPEFPEAWKPVTIR